MFVATIVAVFMLSSASLLEDIKSISGQHEETSGSSLPNFGPNYSAFFRQTNLPGKRGVNTTVTYDENTNQSVAKAEYENDDVDIFLVSDAENAYFEYNAWPYRSYYGCERYDRIPAENFFHVPSRAEFQYIAPCSMSPHKEGPGGRDFCSVYAWEATEDDSQSGEIWIAYETDAPHYFHTATDESGQIIEDFKYVERFYPQYIPESAWKLPDYCH